MPTELRNIKGGGIHYVAYNSLHLVISSLPKQNSSEQDWNITGPKKKDSSKTPEDLLHQIITIQSTTKE